MKRIITTAITVCIAAINVNAQETAHLLTMSAEADLKIYKTNRLNTDALNAAKTKIEKAISMPLGMKLAYAWFTKGEIYKAVISNEIERLEGNPAVTDKGDNDALLAFDAYQRALSYYPGKENKAGALKGIAELQDFLSRMGVVKFSTKKYEQSYLSFKASLDGHDILKQNNIKSIYDDKIKLEKQLEMTASTAFLAKKAEEAIVYFEQLVKTGNARANIYSSLVSCYEQIEDRNSVKRILGEGRKKYPNDTKLLFNEINFLLAEGEYGLLPDLFKQALKAEPKNTTVYNTLATVYDELYKKALRENNTAKADDYFEAVRETFTQSLTIEPNQVAANSGLGVHFYSKSNALQKELNEMPMSPSAAEKQKMKDLEKQSTAWIDKALPYFQKAERIDPNDFSVLLALKNIYLRKEDMEKYNEFKKRYEIVKNGGKNSSSYFK